jgi:hypothetical protein
MANMKAMSAVKGVVLAMLAALAVPACTLDSDTPADPEDPGAQTELDAQRGQDDEDAEEAAVATDEAGILTPTCNSVINWFNAAVPAWNSSTVDCNMVRGTNSSAVRQLQRSMNRCHTTVVRNALNGQLLVEDGDFGGNTERALRAVQGNVGTGVDGQYGPNTRRAMRHESNNVPGTCTRVP